MANGLFDEPTRLTAIGSFKCLARPVNCPTAAKPTYYLLQLMGRWTNHALDKWTVSSFALKDSLLGTIFLVLQSEICPPPDQCRPLRWASKG